jgi:hypothetical protein
LHQRRQELRGNVPGLLRLHDEVHGSRLHVLRVPRRNAGLLRRLLSHRVCQG